MTPEREQAIEDLFERLADQPVSEQKRLLAEACGDDDELFTAVATLLDGDAREHPVLQLDTAHLADALLGTDAAAVTGRVGRYQVWKYLGEGGMGAVYLATREDVGGLVALKFLRNAWASPAARRRFAREQSTLASLTHRHIARLYDTGVSHGQPWFAMEYVDGVSILEHSRRAALDLTARLRLFRDACAAVSFAHRRLVVHLDLKPANVLVDAEGEVKLLDFGIARQLMQDGHSAATTAGNRALLSINYASPEQILGEPLDVQADVFALGVLLYELLVGTVPVDLSKATAATLSAALQQEPQRPSLASGGGGGGGRGGVGGAVRASRAQWRELDIICLKAMSRDKAERYESVERLRADIDHVLNHEPIEAPMRRRWLYRTRKFVTRHRRAVSTAAAVAATLAIVVLFFNVRLIEARDQAVASEARMQRIYRLMLNLFEGDDSAAGPAAGLRVVSLLDRGVREAESLRQEPDLQADLKYTLGGLYHKLGHLDRAEPLLVSALEAKRTLFGADDARTIAPQLALAQLRLDGSADGEARRLAEEALGLARKRYAPGSTEVATATAVVGKVLAAQGKYDEALPLLERAVTTLSLGSEGPELSEALGDLANTHYYLGHVEESEAINVRGLALDRRVFGRGHPNVGVDLYNLGNIALDRAKYAEGERLFREALAINDAWYGAEHPKTAATLLMLGRSAAYVGHAADAERLYGRALEAMRAVYGEHHLRYGSVLSLMGDLARDRGRFDEASRLFEQAAAVFKETVGAEHEFYLHQLSNIGSVLVARGRYREAADILAPSVARLVVVVPDQRYTGLAQIRFAAALTGLGRYREAEQQASAGYTLLQKATAPASVELQEARRILDTVHKHLQEPVT